MSIIAVHKLPIKISLQDVEKILGKAINGQFEALNFKNSKSKGKNKNKIKTCYLRLSEKLDPVSVVQRINDFSHKFNKQFTATVPANVPDVAFNQANGYKKGIKHRLQNSNIGTKPFNNQQEANALSMPAWQLDLSIIKKDYLIDCIDLTDDPQAVTNLPINMVTEQNKPDKMKLSIQQIVKKEIKDEEQEESQVPNSSIKKITSIKEDNNISDKKEDIQSVVKLNSQQRRLIRRKEMRTALATLQDEDVVNRKLNDLDAPSYRNTEVQEMPAFQEELPLHIQHTYSEDPRVIAKRGRKKRALNRKLIRSQAWKMRGNGAKAVGSKTKSVYRNVRVKGYGQLIGDMLRPLQTKTSNAVTNPTGAKPLKTSEISLMNTQRMPAHLRKALNMAPEDPGDVLLKISTAELLAELQAKYPGLYVLCKSTGYKLTKEIRKLIFSRLEALVQKGNKDENTFKLTRTYRRVYPHFGDFQFVLSTLHAIEDAAGVPRSEIQESDLASTAVPNTLDMSRDQLTQMCKHYTGRIVKRLTEHISGLDSEIRQIDTADVIARKQVRKELKKLNFFLPDVINTVMQKHFLPTDGPCYRVRIYGEPFLPNKETLHPFITKYRPFKVMRSSRMYNMIKFYVQPALFQPLMAMNGTVLNGAKLLICSSDIAKYNRVHAPCGGEGEDEDIEDEEEEMDEDMKEEEYEEMEEEL